MKNFIVSALIILAISSCSTTKNTIQPGAFKGKLVVSDICNHFIVTVESGNIDPSRVASSWTDTKRNATYNKAFKVRSVCSFALSGLKEGDEFSFDLANENITENCAVCLAIYPTPSQSLNIRNIKKINP